MQEQIPENVQRWTAKRRAALVLSIVKGETSVQESARKHGLTVAEVEEWQEAQKDEQIKKLKQKVGELVLDIDILKEAMKGRPFDQRTQDE